MVIPIHKIPFIYAKTPCLQLQPLGPGLIISINSSDAYSLKEFIDDFNTQCSNIGLNLYIGLNQSGRIRLFYDDFANYNIVFNNDIYPLFDMPQTITAANASNNIVLGSSSILDRFDQLEKIQIEAIGLQSQQEIIDTERSYPIITDIVVPNDYSLSYTETLTGASTTDISVSYSTRQTVVYNASDSKRFFMLTGNSPIQNITIQAVAIFKDNSRNEIVLPAGSVFSLKMAFYKIR